MEATAFNNLLYSASKSLKAPALKYTSNDRDAANDLIQDTLLKALKHKNKFEEGTNIKAWLFIIMRNTFFTSYHKAKKFEAVDPIEDHSHFITPNTISFNEGDISVNTEEIYKAINKLDQSFREPFMMHFAGYKYEEIVEKLGVPMGSVKNRIHVARKILIQELKDFKK
jgi:RNA polymerase sigma-70 factor (ECF subfamily)